MRSSRSAARPGPVRACLRAAAASLVALLIAGAGLFAISSSSTSVSLVRMALAAVVLALLSSLAGIVTVRRDASSPAARGLYGALVPVLAGLGTGLFVGLGLGQGPTAAVLAGVPWLVGGVLGALLNPFVSDLAWVRLPSRRERRPRRLP